MAKNGTLSVKDIIVLCGGFQDVARITGRKWRAVYTWQNIGIPWEVWHKLIARAKRRSGTALTGDDLLQANRAATRNKAA